MEIDQRTIIDEALIQDVTRRIVDNFHPEKIILFGSHARGDANQDSDLDLIVVMDTASSFWMRAADIEDVLPARTWGLDLIVLTPQEYAAAVRAPGNLVSLAHSEATTLYAA